jgi:hypothetical protein
MKRKIDSVDGKENINVIDDDNVVYDKKRQRNVNLKDHYPKDIKSFVDGMRDDVLDIFSSVKKTFEVLLPFTAVDDIEGSDEIDTCIESATGNNDKTTNDKTTNDKTINNETNAIKKHNDIKEQNDNQYQNTLRMRCSTLHSQKYKQIAKISSSNSPPKPNQSKGSGSIVQLKKLKNSSTLVLYECCENFAIIIGLTRMIYVKKNSDNTALVQWIIPLAQVDSLTIGYTFPLTLIFVLRDAKQVKVNIPDKNTYSSIIMTIQERKEKLIKTSTVT